MAQVVIILTDNDGDVDLHLESDPPLKRNDLTDAQAMALDMMRGAMDSAASHTVPVLG